MKPTKNAALSVAVLAIMLLASFSVMVPADTGAGDSAFILSSDNSTLTGGGENNYVSVEYMNSSVGPVLRVTIKNVEYINTLRCSIPDLISFNLQPQDNPFYLDAHVLAAGNYILYLEGIVDATPFKQSCTFRIYEAHTITSSAGSNGSISPSGKVLVESGSDQTFTITPKSGYVIDQVLVDDVPVTLTGNSYTFQNVTADHSIHATFKTSGGGGSGGGSTTTNYTITSSAGTGGIISPLGNVSVKSGASQTFTIMCSSGYEIDQVLVDGKAVTLAGNSYTFQNVTSNHTISVSFKTSGGETPEPQWTITASAGAGGHIDPTGLIPVNDGDSSEFEIIPNDGYEIDQVLVDGTAVTLAGNTYTFQNVTSNHTISVTFKETSTEPVPGENSGDDNTMYYIIAAIILILVIIAVVYYIMRNKH